MGQAREPLDETGKIQRNQEIEKAKKWLSRGRKMEKRLAALQEKYQRAYQNATTSTVHAHTTSGDKHTAADDCFTAFAVSSVTLKEQIAQLEHTQEEIFQVISQIDDNVLSAALTEYYVNDRTWEEIAELMGYATRHMTRLHRRGLEKIIPLLPQEKEKIDFFDKIDFSQNNK